MRKIILAMAAVAPLLMLGGGVALADAPVVPQVPVTNLVAQANEVTASGSTASQAVVSAASTTTASVTATATATATPTATPTPAPAGEPSIAQLCVATGVDQVDNLLGNASSSRLVGDLKPLVGIAVPQSDHVTLVDAVQLSDVRKRLNCPDQTSTPTATPAPTTKPAPSTTFASCEAAKKAGVATPMLMGSATYQASLDSDHDGIACEANDFVAADTSPLTGGVATGDGSA